MTIDDGLIEYLQGLSRLTLSEEEKERAKADLGSIIAYMGKLGEVDTADAPALSHPFEQYNAFREDVVLDSWDRAEILKNAPAKSEEYFKAPKTVE